MSETVSETTQSEYDDEFWSRGLDKANFFPDQFDCQRDQLEREISDFYEKIENEIKNSKETLVIFNKRMYLQYLQNEEKQVFHAMAGYTDGNDFRES